MARFRRLELVQEINAVAVVDQHLLDAAHLRKILIFIDYHMNWSVTGADSKRLTGKVAFKVQ